MRKTPQIPSILSDFLHSANSETIPEDVLSLGRKWLLDLLGVAAGGSSTRLSHIIRNHAAENFSSNRYKSQILFGGRIVSPAGAALAGGMTIDALDAHDGHRLTKGHVGCGVLPALWAFTQAEGLSDDRAFLASFDPAP